MLRRAKKRDQPLAEAGYEGGSAATGAPSSSSSPMPSSPNQPQQPFYQSRHGSSRHLLNPSQSHIAAAVAADDTSRYPAISPKPNHPRLPSSSSVEAMPPPQAPSAANASQPMGRSQSTLNLFFSKAKNSITGSNQQQQQQQQQQHHTNMNASHSSGSLGSLQEDVAGGASYASSRPSISLQHPGASYAIPSTSAGGRSSSSNDYRQVVTKPSVELDHAPLGLSATSPTKKGFFSRERKTSMATARSPGQSRMTTQQQQQQQQQQGGASSIYSRGPGSSHYGQFSKSQSDLHHMSPRAQYAELPRMPQLPQSIPDERSASGASNTLLTSPSMLGSNGVMSRSVEDLNYPALSSSSSGGGTSAGPRSPSPQPGGGPMYSSSPRGAGTWGEHGMPGGQQQWGRPSDIGTIGPGSGGGGEMSKSRQTSASGSGIARAISPSGSRPDQIPFSSASSQWPPQRGASPTPDFSQQQQQQASSAYAGHQRKTSKLPMVGSDGGFFGGGQGGGGGRERKATGSSLASSFSLTNVAAGASSVMDKLRGGSSSGSIASVQQQQQQQGYYRERASSSADSLKDLASASSTAAASVPLPPGCTHQGLLNRNGNLSLSLAQLGGPGTREREKDVTKGWKPYKVLLRDHSLVFYKPSSNLAEDVKAWFPSGIVRASPAGDGAGSSSGLSQAYASQKLDADMLKQSGLGTRDLLNATSSGASGAPAAPSKSGAMASPSKKLPGAPLTAAAAATMSPASSPASTSWHVPGAHADLILVTSRERPEHWAQRIHSGTLEALVHEIVYATQLLAQDDPQDTATMVQTTILSALASGHSLIDFISHLSSQVTSALQGQAEAESQGATEALRSAVRGRAGWCFDVLLAKYADAIDAQAQLMLEQLVSNTEGLDIDVAAAIKEQSSAPSVPRPVPMDWSKQVADPPRPRLASLASGVFSASDLLSFEPADVASQIQIFHADRLRALAIPEPTMSALAATSEGTESSATLFSFSGTRPHYLTTLILEQVLDCRALEASEGSSNSSAATLAQHARHRASLLRHWIAIASYSLTYGDVLAWTAIMAALCSRAISRLEHTWRLVAEGDRTLLASSWAPKLSKLQWNEDGSLAVEAAVSMSSVTTRTPKSKDGRKPHCVPFLGDALVEIVAASSASGGQEQQQQQQHIAIASLTQSSDRLYDAITKWAGQTFKGTRLQPDAIIFVARPIVEFQQLLQILSSQSQAQSPPVKPISSFLEPSLRLEPRTLGNIDRSWRPPLPAALNAKTLVPLVFPEALPNLDLFDRRQIVSCAASDDHRMGSANLSRDYDATIRGASGGGGVGGGGGASRYVRSPLSGTPLMRASIQSLSRSKVAGMGSPGARAAAMPFGLITEWASNRGLSSNGVGSAAEDETLHRIGNDLILKSLDDAPVSLPSTPMTSKRFSQDFGSRATRPLSQVSRRSSLPASQRSSVIETVLPTQVAVKAGTLERLVDVLVLGVTDLSISLNGGSNDESANGGGAAGTDPTRISRLSLDLPTYRSAFLATFRSTCSPIVLFDFLRKRFLAAVNAGREIPNLPQGPNASRFPSWSLIDASAGQALEPVEWDFVGRVRQGVIAVMKQWVRSYTQDFVDEPELYDAVIAFAKGQASGVKAAKPDDTDLSRAIAGLEEVAALLRSSAFKTNARHARDVATTKSTRPSSSSAAASAVSRDLDFDFDQATPVALVDYLESVAGVFFDKITERDLLIAAELLERQAQDPLGWHIVRDAGPDEPQVLTMYKLLELLKPAAATALGNSSSRGGAPSSSSSSPSLGERMPAAVRDACAAQSLLRGWIAIHIIESRIGVHHRQKRIEKLIDAIWLCRARMVRARNGPEDAAASNGLASPSLPAATPFQDATVGSFVESIILASLTASESRTFVRAWQGVCHARGGTGEGLEDLLPRQDALAALNQAAAVTSFPSATPDVGWLLRSIAQAVSRRSAVAQADSTYVDFERSQIVHNLIESSLAIRRQPASGSDGTTKTNAPAIDPKAAELAGARLSMMQTKLRKIVWDRRAFKEDAAHEANSVPPLPRDTTWRAYRPLQKLMAEQQDKQQRDRHAFETLRAALDAAKTSAAGARSPGMGPQEIVGRASTSSAVSLMVPPGGGGGGSLPADKKSRRMTSLWRGAARLGGGSVAGSSGGAGSVMGGDLVGQRPYADLVAAIPISQKPSNIVALGGAEVNVWNNSQRSFLFHVNSLDGQRMLLQASGQAELADWLTQIDKAVREGPRPLGSSSDARRRGFGAAGSGKATSTSTANFTSLFGNDITTLVEKEGRAIPLGLERMFTEIESRGLQEVGIYRISGSKSTIEAMEQAFRTKPPDSIDLQHGDFSDVHAISGLIKLWFRELPEPVVPYAFYHAIVEAEQLENSDDRLIALRDLIWSFPKAHFDLLRRTCEHLARVVEEGEKNKMLPHNIGLIFGTSLLNPPPSATSVAEAFGQIGRKANFVKIIVQYYEWVFAEAEEEGEGEAEAEVDADADGLEDVVEQEDKGDAASAPSLGLENIDEVSTASTTAAPAPPSSNDHEGVTADELLLQLQSDASAAAAAAAATNAGGFSSIDRDGSVDSQRRAQASQQQQQQQPPPTSSTAPINVSTADASSIGQALKRPDLPRRDSRREELSIYQDAVDIDLGESAAVAVRSSLLPDEAMMDVLRAMRHDEEMQREQALQAAQQGQQQQQQQQRQR